MTSNLIKFYWGVPTRLHSQGLEYIFGKPPLLFSLPLSTSTISWLDIISYRHLTFPASTKYSENMKSDDYFCGKMKLSTSAKATAIPNVPMVSMFALIMGTTSSGSFFFAYLKLKCLASSTCHYHKTNYIKLKCWSVKAQTWKDWKEFESTFPANPVILKQSTYSTTGKHFQSLAHFQLQWRVSISRESLINCTPWG